MANHVITVNFKGSAHTSSSTVVASKVTGSFAAGASIDIDPAEITYIRNVKGDFVATTVSALNIVEVLIERSQVWWNKNYIYRRIIQVQPNPMGLNVGHPLTSILGKDLLRQNKIRLDVQDIEVLRLVSFVPETWEVIPKSIELLDRSIRIRWDNQISINPNTILSGVYYIYYGNPPLTDKPTLPAYTYTQWPLSIDINSQDISYTRPGEHWSEGIATAYHAKMTFTFYGERVRVWANKDASYGIVEIQIDDDDWQSVDLYQSTVQEQVVFTVEDLSIGYHTLRYRVSGNKHPNASDYTINFTKIDYSKHAQAINLGEEADETLLWSSAIGGVIGG